ncbi:unnamed protein product, partial [Lepidochelys olivacea]
MEAAPSSQAPCKGSKSQRLQGIEEEPLASPPLDYRQYLYSLLGPERAEYFLSPPALERCRSPGEQGLLEAVGGASAEELWQFLHEEPGGRGRDGAGALRAGEGAPGLGHRLSLRMGLPWVRAGFAPIPTPQRWSPLWRVCESHSVPGRAPRLYGLGTPMPLLPY